MDRNISKTLYAILDELSALKSLSKDPSQKKVFLARFKTVRNRIRAIESESTRKPEGSDFQKFLGDAASKVIGSISGRKGHEGLYEAHTDWQEFVRQYDGALSLELREASKLVGDIVARLSTLERRLEDAQKESRTARLPAAKKK